MRSLKIFYSTCLGPVLINDLYQKDYLSICRFNDWNLYYFSVMTEDNFEETYQVGICL